MEINPQLGHLCGYVGVLPEHPYYVQQGVITLAAQLRAVETAHA